MALAFNVSAGPLAQVGIEIVDLPTAMYLVKRLWNWKQQSESLIQVLSAGGAHLVSTSSFNLLEYRRVRKRGDRGLLGIFVQDGSVESTRLPKASSAVPNDPGQACLRALATAILCLYGSETAVAVLQGLIPYALLQQDQDDVNVAFEGPVLASLTDWVRSVAAEEDCDNIRDELLKEVARRESELTGLPVEDLLNMDLGQPSELPFVIGVLKWGLTPTARRMTPTYATRSLRAWSMAAILHQLGFLVYAAAYIAHDPSSEDVCNPSRYDLGESEVFIDTRAGAVTDAMITSCAIANELHAASPVVTHIGDIPRLAFRHARGAPYGISTAGLNDIWYTSFRVSRRGLRRFTLKESGAQYPTLTIRCEEASKTMLPAFHQRLLDLFKKHRIATGFDSVLAPVMLANVPLSEEEGWSPVLIDECLRTGTCYSPSPELQKMIKRNSYVLKAIVLGAMYGVCSNALIIHGLDNDDDEIESVLSLEIAFSVDIFVPANFDKLVSWVTGVQSVCNSVLDFRSMPPDPFSWFELLASIFLGQNFQSSEPEGVAPRTLCRKYAGLLLISDFLVRPTLCLEATFRCHILRGQLLNLPDNGDGTVQPAKFKPSAAIIKRGDEATMDLLAPCARPANEGRGISLAVEPCWEIDPQKVVFKFRLKGATLTSVEVGLSGIQHLFVQQACQCDHPSAKIELSVSGQSDWHHITVHDIICAAPRHVSFTEGTIDRPKRYLIDASSTEATTLFVLGSIRVQEEPYIVWSCLKCAVDMMNLRYQQRKTKAQILLIPWGHTLGRHTVEHKDKVTAAFQTFGVYRSFLSGSHRTSSDQKSFLTK